MRVNRVKHARKSPGACGACGETIAKGEAYKYVEPRYRARMVRHERCRDWRPSELTSSDKLAQLYGATESYEEGVPYGSPEDWAQALRDLSEQVKEVAEGYRESAQNIEDGFQHSTQQSDELNERADELESWGDEIESAADDVEGIEQTCGVCGNEEDAHPDHEFWAETETYTDEAGNEVTEDTDNCRKCDGDDDTHHEFESDWESEAESAADVAGNCPV